MRLHLLSWTLTIDDCYVVKTNYVFVAKDLPVKSFVMFTNQIVYMKTNH